MEKTRKTDADGRQQSLVAVESLFANAITRIKTQAAQTSAEQRENSEAQAQAQAQQAIAKIKLDSEILIANEKAETKKAAEQIIKAKVEENAKALAEHVTQLKTKHANQIADTKTVYEQKIAKIKLDNENTIVRVKEDAQRETRVIVEEKTRAFVDRIARLEAELIEKAKAYTEQITRITTETEVSIANIEAEYEQQLDKAKTDAEEKQIAHTEEIFNINTEREEAIANIKAEYEEQIAEAETKAEEEQKAHAEEIVNLNTEKEETVAKIKAEYEEQIAKTETEETQKAHAEEIVNINTEREEAIANIKAEYEEQIAKTKTEAEEIVATVKTEFEESKKTHNEEVAGFRDEVEEKVRSLTEQITELKTNAAEKQEAATTTESDNSAADSVSQIIQRTAQSPANLPGERPLANLAIYAEDIMQKELIWGKADDDVQQAFAKMKQQCSSYIMIGTDGSLEGIVSKSDLASALSPYLRPEFAKWRRSLDDATLQLKVKWVMSRPVHIISPQTPLDVIMSSMCRFRVRALPVVDKQGKVLGLVTEADIFKTILKPNDGPGIPASDKTDQVQSEFPKPPERTRNQPSETNPSSPVPA